MKFKKRNVLVENEEVILMMNEGCTNTGCDGTNVGECWNNNNTAGCGR